MDDPNITMEAYIRLEEEKSRRREFPSIVFNDTLTSKAPFSYEPTISSLNNDEIDFRISFDESDDEDYTESYKCFSNIGGRLSPSESIMKSARVDMLLC
nr:hypothetical protein [Tanacetum cinerariifolium]